MAVLFDSVQKTLTIQTRQSTYQMGIGPYNSLLHYYYGPKIEGDSMAYRLRYADRGFAGNPYEAGKDRTFSFDYLPQEYPVFGVGDFRTTCLTVADAQGGRACDLRYGSHKIYEGKPALRGLPSVNGDGAQTLEVCLQDTAGSLSVTLFYSALEEYDAITRWTVIRNTSREPLFLEEALSCCLDVPCDQMDWVTFYGRHAMERQLDRAPLRHGNQGIESVRGASSHQQNPFVILCDSDAGERTGCCFGMSFVYSGNFIANAQVGQFGHTRLTMGIHPKGFSWKLEPGESFTAPEVILCHSEEGLGGLTRRLHRLLRERVCRGEWSAQQRPVLINSWEAAYFDFDCEKLLDIARAAAPLGVDLLVMDDGWFGNRNSDCSGLGDWTVNEGKLGCTLQELSRRVKALGLGLGIWFEPEMVSEDSELYRSHPDWCLRNPGRATTRSRYQLVLDMSRSDVREYLFSTISGVLQSADITYVKWDMNRHLTNVWSAVLPADRQGEVYHRYMLGVYHLLERLTAAFPHVLFEGCAGGGGRFDAGMLYYTPQIWCSDNTDAIDRISIQYGTSFGYPLSAVGAHASACPNHQTGRTVPLETRGVVAMAGTFGYELDLTRLPEEERNCVKRQIAFYKQHYQLINRGDYYRLTNAVKNRKYAAWMTVSPSKNEALFTIVLLESVTPPEFVRLDGLDPEKRYQINGGKEAFGGAALMKAGLAIPLFTGPNQCWQAVLTQV